MTMKSIFIFHIVFDVYLFAPISKLYTGVFWTDYISFQVLSNKTVFHFQVSTETSINKR